MRKVILKHIPHGTWIRVIEDDGDEFHAEIQELDEQSLAMLQSIFDTDEIDAEIRRTTPVPSPYKR
jgi:hypothetical protein